MAISLTESFPRASASLGDRIHALTHHHHGTGLVILNREATHLLVVQEIKPKQASERRIGQYSPPLETAKRGMLGFGTEKRRQTRIGALAEILSDEELPAVGQRLRRILSPLPSTLPLSRFIRADVSVVVFDGDISESPFPVASFHEEQNAQTPQPAACEETIHPQWVEVEAFLASPHARPWGRRIVEYVQEAGLLQPDLLLNYPSEPALGNVSSINAFYKRRERRKDVVLRRETA